MTVVHEYVPSSDKSGFYLRDGFDGTIVTYQVSGLAENLLYQLDYDDGETLKQELFDILHRLRLIYTHNSGVEPLDSLLDIDLDESDVQALDTGDREAIITHLLGQSQLDEDQQAELRAYAEQRGITLSAATEEDADSSSTDDSESGNASETTSRDDAAQNGATEGSNELTELPRVKCEYCGETVEAVDYVSHVCSLSGSHGETGEPPDGFSPGAAELVSSGDVDILYQEDFSSDCTYYPICRWCGARFFRLPSYQIHIGNNNRGEFNEALHSRNPDRYQRPVLLPFEDNHVVTTTDSVQGVVTSEAVSNLEFATGIQQRSPKPGKHGISISDDTELEEQSKEDSDGRDTGGKSGNFDSRIEVYEQNWVLTDLARLLNLLMRSVEDETETHTALSRHHTGILNHNEELISANISPDGTLRSYRQTWDEPEIGVKVPEEVLAEYDFDDYRGNLYVPPGYPIPIDDVYTDLLQQWFDENTNTGNPSAETGSERLFGSKRAVTSRASGEEASDSEKKDDGSSSLDDSSDLENGVGSVGQPVQSDEDSRATDSDIDEEVQVPVSVLQDVIHEFEAYEDNRREASWFHASMILRDAIESELEKPIVRNEKPNKDTS